MIIDPVKLSQKLIRCRSVTPKDDGAMDIVEDAISSLGFKCHRLKFGDIENLYAKLGDKEPNLCFAGHTDVVPADDESKWTFNPFAAEINDGMLIGRGAVDMKCAIAAWIAAISNIVDKKQNIAGSLSLIITGDEENLGIDGTRKILRWLNEQEEKIDACVVGEPTNPEKIGDMIKIGRRGSISFSLTVNGVDGHVAYPHLAENPIPKIVNILNILSSHKLDDGSEFFQPSNLEITTIDVGNSVGNVIPQEAVAKFNIRYNDLHSPENLEKFVRNTCDSVTTNYTLDFSQSSNVFMTKPDVLSNIVQKAVHNVSGIIPVLGTDGGTSDARFIKDVCPVVEFGLVNKTAHKVNEYAFVKDIIMLSEIYESIIKKYCDLIE